MSIYKSLLVFFLCCFCHVSQAQYLSPRSKIVLSVAGVDGLENLDWSIAGNLKGQNPNVYSELIWQNLRASGIDIKLKGRIVPRVFVVLQGSERFINDGSATDSDYENDNRQSRVFFADLKSDKGLLRSYSGAAGYQILITRPLVVTTYLGYQENIQRLFLLDEFSDDTPNSLNTRYHTQWRGPMLMMEGELRVCRSLIITPAVQYSQVNYHATADWNLIDAFQHPKSFEHEAKGYQLAYNLNISTLLSRKWSCFLGGVYQQSSTGTGIDHLYLKTGQVVQTRLNSVNGSSYAVKFGMCYQF
jgi:hypothetical protein